MIPRSGGEKVYLEAAYRRPKLLVTVIFAVQAVALGFTGASHTSFSQIPVTYKTSPRMHRVRIQYGPGIRKRGV